MPTPNVPAEARERFRSDLDRLLTPDRSLIVAVSGGPDSLALLLLAHAVLGDQCSAVTVDHGLRPESADEARHVAAICAQIGVPHETVTIPPRPDAQRAGINISDWARNIRYELLFLQSLVSGAWVATAHHADDQVETLLMRLNRGSGVAGLAAVRPTVRNFVIRPLLDWRRAELAALVDHAGLTAISDPSNVDDRYDRARLRKAIASADWIDARAFSRSARALDEANQALEWATDQLLARIAVPVDDPARRVLDMARADGAIPHEIVRRLVRRMLHAINPDCDPREAALTSLIEALNAKGGANVGGVLARAAGSHWVFEPEPPRRTG